MHQEIQVDKSKGAATAKFSGSPLINRHFASLKNLQERIHGKETAPVGKLAELPSSFQYCGTGGSTRYVLSGKATAIPPVGNYDGLYTTGVNTCSALAIVAKTADGAVLNVTLAHISPITGRAWIKGVYSDVRKISGREAVLESSVIGGEATAKLVLEMAREEGKVKFEFIETNPSLEHSVVVDKNGAIYYGRRMDLDIFCLD
ncbi:Uncharacterised protein [uncultured archaeon]|nr:Uncharacterised protein [uncultured archaeon]